MPNAFDMDALPTAAMVPAMKAAGTRACIIYSRLVTREVVELLSANDIDTVIVGEWGTGADPEHYTADNGLADAERLLAELAAQDLHPPGVYVCNGDFDANAEQIAGGITDYRRAVKNVLDGAGIGAGGYGNGANLAAGLDDGTILKAFVWAGRSTNGTVAFTESGRWSIRQYPTATEFGASVDPDEVQGDYWGFRVSVTAPQPIASQSVPSSPAWYTRPLSYGDEGEDVKEAQRLLDDVAVDGIFGRGMQAAVRQFQRTAGLVPDGVIGPMTAAALSAPR